ncbi:LysE family translocator [Flavobacterium aciduliphilum]|jgi:threonine/homoserine/homoserine lactone efflux protein|uniref:Threonine/homoserine/homoserine lactone efflux protein n=1 Tax=Flavobacterium aciduliphilum TaxID=1101402 RepID=A0A328YR14_9FLAO|nr:LysE family transporter [Flavobacterium aciduliphilum]RAR72516.1 threonine/homoserine/homoserine lactone efflux protein [Flavobacterium aciduliphilum]
MPVIIPLLFGFVFSFIGVIPPGLINITAAKVSMTDGKKRAFMFVLGALLVIFFQTYISVIFAHYINSHKEIDLILREIGLLIFVVLTIYFLKFAKPPQLQDKKIDVKSKRSRFFMGMFISAINVFPIPYYVLISLTLASNNSFIFTTIPIYSFVIGVVLGSFTVFYFYVMFFNKIGEKATFVLKNINTILGIITGIIAFFTCINVLKNYVHGG